MEADYYYDLNKIEGYAGAKPLVKIFPKSAKKWLSSQLAYSLHKPAPKKFATRSYKTSGKNDLWQADLMEMIPYARVNKGYKYILNVIDVFSRYVYSLPMKTKSANEMKECLELLFKSTKPNHLQTDQGKEFYNAPVANLLKTYNINHYSVYSKQKCALVERFNRTLRTKLNRYFTHTGKKVWYNVLESIVKTYNNTPHRGIDNKAPASVKNTYELWEHQQKSLPVPKDSNIRIGDYCRISRNSGGPFTNKNFDQNWSEEIFRVVGVDKRDFPIMYNLQDLKGEDIAGKFYKQELQVIDELPQTYRIEKILATKGKGVHKQYYVKWYGYNEKSWISASAIE